MNLLRCEEKIIKPHQVISRKVEEGDIERVLEDAEKMIELCFKKSGIYAGGYAVAHQQVEDRDPLRFFVTKDKEIIINPEIVELGEEIEHREGCLSFPKRKMKKVKRGFSCVVDLQVEDFQKHRIELEGMDAYIMQHEIEHFDCQYIFKI